MTPRSLRLLFLSLLILCPVDLLAAQSGRPPPKQPPPRPPAWRAEAETMGANVLLGAVATALVRGLRGESIGRGLYEGAAGGAVMYAGKRVVAADMSGAGLLGRPIAAVGASMVRNSSAGEPALSQLVLPVGVVRLYLTPGAERMVRARLDLAGTLTTVYAAFDGDLRFNPGATLSAGTPVFYHRRGAGDTAQQGAGVVWLTNPAFTDARGEIFRHERVHVLQYDAAFIAAAEPAERWLFAKLPGGATIGRHIDLGINVAAWGLLNLLIDYDKRPWEREAYLLTRK